MKLSYQELKFIKYNKIFTERVRDINTGSDIYYIYKANDDNELTLLLKYEITDEDLIKDLKPTITDIISRLSKNTIITREFFENNSYWRDLTKKTTIDTLVDAYHATLTSSLDVHVFAPHGSTTIHSMKKIRVYIPPYYIDPQEIANYIANNLSDKIESPPYLYDYDKIEMFQFLEDLLIANIFITTK